MELQNKYPEKLIIQTYHELKNMSEVSKKLNISYYVILRIIEKYKIKKYQYRKYSFNENYFDNIDTEEKAYFLGFLWADGNNYLAKNKRGTWAGVISLSLSEKDVCILEKFKKIINSQKPLYKYKSGIRKKDGKIYYCKDKVTLNINSLKLSKFLNNIGLIPNKTEKLKMPKNNFVPECLMHHFIRGYFDGDGCISKNFVDNNYYYYFSICMKNYDFCIEIINILNKYLNYNFKYKKDGSIYTIYTSSYYDTNLLGEWIYKNATIFLERKKIRFLDFINKYNIYKNKKTSNIKNITKERNKFVVKKIFNKVQKNFGKFKTEQEAIQCLKNNNLPIIYT